MLVIGGYKCLCICLAITYSVFCDSGFEVLPHRTTFLTVMLK